jgi:hypothetical protein
VLIGAGVATILWRHRSAAQPAPPGDESRAGA